MSVAYKTIVVGAVSTVSRDLMLRQAFNTTETIKNTELTPVTIFELDATAGPIKDIKVEFWLAADNLATFNLAWSVTREGAPVTFVDRDTPDTADIVNPLDDARYEYVYEDLPEGAQLKFTIGQDNNGHDNNAVDAVLTYLLAS